MATFEEEKVTVTYFPVSARGQFVTDILDIIGRKYELNTIKNEDWGVEKQNTPFGALPVLDVDGKKIGGSLVIARFVAERYGKSKLHQESDPFISALYEGQADICNDILVKLFSCIFAKEADKAVKDKEFVSYANDKLSFLEKSIHSGGVFQGKDGKLTWSEIVINSLLRDIKKFYEKHDEIFGQFPNLSALCDNVCKLLPEK